MRREKWRWRRNKEVYVYEWSSVTSGNVQYHKVLHSEVLYSIPSLSTSSQLS